MNASTRSTPRARLRAPLIAAATLAVATVAVAVGDAVRRRRAIPGLGQVAKIDGYTYRYATQNRGRGPNWRG